MSEPAVGPLEELMCSSEPLSLAEPAPQLFSPNPYLSNQSFVRTLGETGTDVLQDTKGFGSDFRARAAARNATTSSQTASSETASSETAAETTEAGETTEAVEAGETLAGAGEAVVGGGEAVVAAGEAVVGGGEAVVGGSAGVVVGGSAGAVVGGALLGGALFFTLFVSPLEDLLDGRAAEPDNRPRIAPPAPGVAPAIAPSSDHGRPTPADEPLESSLPPMADPLNHTPAEDPRTVDPSVPLQAATNGSPDDADPKPKKRTKRRKKASTVEPAGGPATEPSGAPGPAPSPGLTYVVPVDGTRVAAEYAPTDAGAWQLSLSFRQGHNLEWHAQVQYAPRSAVVTELTATVGGARVGIASPRLPPEQLAALRPVLVNTVRAAAGRLGPVEEPTLSPQLLAAFNDRMLEATEARESDPTRRYEYALQNSAVILQQAWPDGGWVPAETVHGLVAEQVLVVTGNDDEVAAHLIVRELARHGVIADPLGGSGDRYWVAPSRGPRPDAAGASPGDDAAGR